MSDNLIITIGRECGSGGRHIGQALAEKLGIKCYDTELLNLAAKESGLCKDKESCVIIGRCADYALADYPNVVSVFITADEDVKIKTLMERHKITESQAKDLMIKTDKKRSSYYNYYSSKRWGDSKSYDLCMNSSKIGYDGVVKMIQEFAKIKGAYKK